MAPSKNVKKLARALMDERGIGYQQALDEVRGGEPAPRQWRRGNLVSLPPVRVTRKMINQALEEHPVLTYYGYGRGFGTVSAEDHVQYRQELERIEVARVQRLVDYLIATFLPTKRITEANSYGLKHKMEVNLGPYEYVSNGEAILAAIIAGYPMTVDDGGINTGFGMSMRDYDAVSSI